jgi:hypothetical protein
MPVAGVCGAPSGVTSLALKRKGGDVLRLGSVGASSMTVTGAVTS